MADKAFLASAIAELKQLGHDPERPRGDNYVQALAGILERGTRTWRQVGDAVAATPPDFGAADQLLRTKLTFENDRNPAVASFEQDIRIAKDATRRRWRSSAVGLPGAAPSRPVAGVSRARSRPPPARHRPGRR